MNDQTSTSLGDLLKTFGGSLKTGPFGTALKAAEYSKLGGVPIISVGEVGYGTLRVGKSTPRVGEDVLRRLPEYILRPGDIVFGRKGAVDRCGLVRENEDGYFLGSDGIRLRLGSGIDPEFLTYQFQSSRVRNWLISNSSGTTMASLNQEILGRVHVNLPTLLEQRRAAKGLNAADDLIAALERLIVKKQAIKQGMMQQLLTGRIRLPGFVRDWTDRRLGDVLTIRHGRNQRSVESSSGTVPILATGGQIGWADRPLYSKPSVLIGRKGTIDRPQYQDRPFWTVDTLFYTEIAADADPRFLYYLFQTVDWRSMNEASGVPSLSSTRIEGVEVRLPDLTEQVTIRGALDDTTAEITALDARLAKVRAIKTGMMQQLLTGRAQLPTEVAL
ncbi:MAG: restriction endonuclease subunit S [Mycobacterium sp.]